jgi:hypothetical protein
MTGLCERCLASTIELLKKSNIAYHLQLLIKVRLFQNRKRTLAILQTAKRGLPISFLSVMNLTVLVCLKYWSVDDSLGFPGREEFPHEYLSNDKSLLPHNNYVLHLRAIKAKVIRNSLHFCLTVLKITYILCICYCVLLHIPSSSAH